MKSDETNVGHLEEEALKRKERLDRLKAMTAKENGDNNSHDRHALPKPTFRSYNPNDEKLKERSLPKGKPESVEDQIKDQLSESKEEPVIDEV
ncbi:unnamed protein product, partial [Medioppia subpectinata]